LRWCGRDIVTMCEAELRAIRGGQISRIFEEPTTALNPVLPIGSRIEESLKAHIPRPS